MKTIFVIAIAAASFTACNNAGTGSTDTDTIITDSSFTDTMPAAPVTTDTVTSAYTPVEGDVIYRDNKVYVMKNGTWVEANNDVTLDNGAVVYKTGTVKKDKQEIKLKEGEMVSKTGNFFDKAGHAFSNAWGQTKDAVKDAGKAIDKTAKKAGAKVDSIVH